MRLHAVFAAWSFLFVTCRLSAEEPPTPFRVEYGAASACGESTSFTEQLLARTRRVAVAEPGQDKLRFVIDVRSEGGVMIGALSIRDPEAAMTRREVPGKTCDEVIAAMALIAAMLVDPNANVEPLGLEENAAKPPAPAAAAPVAPVAAEPAPSTKATDPVPPRRAKPDESTRWTVGALAAIALEGAVAPTVATGLSFGIELGIERSELLSPLLALAGERTFSTTATTEAGVARFRWSGFRATACPVRLPATGFWAFRPCAFFELGSLKASGEATNDPGEATVPWTAAGGLARGEATVFDYALVALEVGVVLPLRRDTFYFDPEQANTAYEIPPVAFAMRAGIGARF